MAKVKDKIKFFNERKGYGFIIQDNVNEDDLFVHITDVESGQYPETNQRVTYEISASSKGLKATSVELL